MGLGAVSFFQRPWWALVTVGDRLVGRFTVSVSLVLTCWEVVMFVLVVRFSESGDDTVLETADVSSFARVLNAALAVMSYVPVHLWTISAGGNVVASWMTGQDAPFIDHKRLSSFVAAGFPWERG